MMRKILIGGMALTLILMVQFLVVAKVEDPKPLPERLGFLTDTGDGTDKSYFQKDGEWYVKTKEGLVGKINFLDTRYSRMGPTESVEIAWEDGTVSYWSKRPSFSRKRIVFEGEQLMAADSTMHSVPLVDVISNLERFDAEGNLIEREGKLAEEPSKKKKVK